jgi:hypothetical protein
VIDLGMVVARRGSWPMALGLTRAAIAASHKVALFVMDDACAPEQLADGQQLEALCSNGVEIIFCGTSVDTWMCKQRLPPSAIIGSQMDHARLLQTARRWVSLT